MGLLSRFHLSTRRVRVIFHTKGKHHRIRGDLGSRDGAVVRALASHQCDPLSIPAWCHVCQFLYFFSVALLFYYYFISVKTSPYFVMVYIILESGKGTPVPFLLKINLLSFLFPHYFSYL